jgi:large subunit ribosomal protein L21
MYAVVTTGGKQYRVEAGSELTIERLGADAGASITFDRVLLVGDGDAVTVGTPTVDGATVSATVLGEALGPKLAVFKFKQKVKYRRMAGHRQHLVRVRIDEISANGSSSKAKAKAEPKATETGEEKPKRTRTATASAAKADAPEAAEEKPKRTRKASASTSAAKAAKAEPAEASAEEKPKRTRKAPAKKTAKAEE